MNKLVKKVYGVGVGVGDKKLLTLKALEVLKKVDKIFVPVSKKGKKSIAYEIIKDYVDGKNIEELLFPMIKDKERLKKYWENALEKVLKEDGEVAIITIGDPTLYSTFSYVWKLLKERGVEVEIVNGISSIFASAAALNIPLVEGDEKLCILPQGKDLEKYIDEFDTIIIMKTKNLNEKLSVIKNRDDYIIGLVKRATFEDEKVVIGKLDEINFDEFNDYLSLAIIKRFKR
ncbi:TPA: precorrin-2 C(20)-methyltransferase [Methanocaldococcus jannaschii]|uniref:Probable cobalt-precorrin-2 C(20)-methyltransferase n=2 Tax=Methanocaldococcus jannaschii TaxID=2190 RepID=CBIL_METJA|nr:precorrin-2 C(20)-methyltransferase [Methanocaldococcus jannaschii]Q58181.1 RecName: Full=Probable cobalt-precorrin-2 C(20)-methyltransferase; AltName: Full=S-adenosyl-L-methionine--cobalt-precorrin-2 methyltransferase [Methanocaldococcus jannaschii DSM 2661]AAB98764.1 cobalamin biosynthesis precorrin-2 methyltransferase (cbiL) [Methanocaldococcus jannaschii DSM 2661]HII59313.1 precorrin-2 C(20)-methyltransferase [Methanocaldococcus jannaschii]